MAPTSSRCFYRATLSESISFRSTHAPERIFSTIFPGIGGRADDRMSGGCAPFELFVIGGKTTGVVDNMDAQLDPATTDDNDVPPELGSSVPTVENGQTCE